MFCYKKMCPNQTHKQNYSYVFENDFDIQSLCFKIIYLINRTYKKLDTGKCQNTPCSQLYLVRGNQLYLQNSRTCITMKYIHIILPNKQIWKYIFYINNLKLNASRMHQNFVYNFKNLEKTKMGAYLVDLLVYKVSVEIQKSD